MFREVGQDSRVCGQPAHPLQLSSSAEVRHLQALHQVSNRTDATWQKSIFSPWHWAQSITQPNLEAASFTTVWNNFFAISSQTCSVATGNQIRPCLWLPLSCSAGYSSSAQCAEVPACSRPLEADGAAAAVSSSSLESFRTKSSSRMSKRQKTRCLKWREDKA